MRCAILFVPFLILAINVSAQNAEVEAAFRNLFAGHFSEDEPGGSILVIKGDDIIFQESYGLADLQTGEKITGNTVFNTGSISKTFVSNGILILQESGNLSVEDPISRYFDDFESKEISEQVQIKHLLSHTSGLPDIRNVRSNPEFFLTARDAGNFNPIKKAKRLNSQPGENFQYSNPAYNGLALIIEQVSNKKWQQFIEENIFIPSGMKTSKITDGPHPDSGVAHAYVLENGKYQESDYGEVPTFAASGNGGIWSSVLELAKYETAIREHVFLNEKTIQKSRTPFHPDAWKGGDPPFIGYSWFLGERSLMGSEGQLDVYPVYHTGSQGGFRAFYISIPEKEILYVALFNRPVDKMRDWMKEGLLILKNVNWLESK